MTCSHQRKRFGDLHLELCGNDLLFAVIFNLMYMPVRGKSTEIFVGTVT